SAVGLRGIRRREHLRFRLLAVLRPELPEALNRPAERELRAAEALDEVAAPTEAERLERLELSVDGAVPALDALAADAVPGHDPLSLEEQLCESAAVGLADEQPLGARPASLGRGDLGRAPSGEPARPALGLRHSVAPLRTQRLPGVVRDLARPDEIPERRQRDLGLEAGLRE